IDAADRDPLALNLDERIVAAAPEGGAGDGKDGRQRCTVLFVMDRSGPLSATCAAAAAAAGSPLKSATVTRSPPESRGSGPASNVESMSWISADGVVLVSRAPSSMAKPEQHAPGVPKAGPNP